MHLNLLYTPAKLSLDDYNFICIGLSYSMNIDRTSYLSCSIKRYKISTYFSFMDNKILAVITFLSRDVYDVILLADFVYYSFLNILFLKQSNAAEIFLENVNKKLNSKNYLILYQKKEIYITIISVISYLREF